MNQDIQINAADRFLQLEVKSLPESCVIVICDGEAKVRALPPYGEYNVVTHQGKVKRMYKGEGEEF